MTNETAQCGRCGHDKDDHLYDEYSAVKEGCCYTEESGEMGHPLGMVTNCDCHGFSPAAPPPKCECGQTVPRGATAIEGHGTLCPECACDPVWAAIQEEEERPKI